jgi:hypothetical protein
MASFVDCDDTTGTCFCKPTFDGNATAVNKCRCPAGKQVYFPAFPLGNGGFLADGVTWNPSNWGFRDPICIDLNSLLALQAADLKNQQHVAFVRQFLDNTIGTTPRQILSDPSVMHTILDDNVKSRISPAGEFNGFEGVVEYFYGFVAAPSLTVTKVRYISVTASGNFVAAKADLTLATDPVAAAVTGGHPPTSWNLTTFAFFTFNPANDKILSIDVSVPNLGILLDIPVNQLPLITVPGFPAGTTSRTINVASTCAFMLTPTTENGMLPAGTCGGNRSTAWQLYGAPPTPQSFIPIANGGTGYNSPQDQLNRCIGYLSAQIPAAQVTTLFGPGATVIPWGTRDRNNANNFVCRQLHSALTLFRPDPHCYHSGPLGGGRCIDIPYSDYYLQDY